MIPTIHVGDCIDVMRSMESNSVDSIVCDPPYSLPGGFMGKKWDNFDGREDVAFGYWLAGFTDGEGCFRVQRHERGTHTCAFQIKLRRDDKRILERIRGFIGHGTVRDAEGDGNSKPQAVYVVQDKEGCEAVVGLFRRFPLTAKKAIDFEVWAESVGEWVNRPRGNRWHGQSDQTNAAALKSRLESVRVYVDIPWSGHRFQDWCRVWATECLRVLKPGGHMVAFGGTRTYHRLTCAVEDAGFEIRDSLGWIYGSGFPKSLDVSKAIDKARNDQPDILRVTSFMADAADRVGISRAEVDTAMGTSDMGGWWLSRLLHRCQCPKWDQWLQLKTVLSLSDEMDAEVWRLNGRKGTPGEAWESAEIIAVDKRMNEASGIVSAGRDERVEVERKIKAPNSEAAQQWQGWGTALKPAWEPIILARKPLGGTVAANVLKHGTGAMNIDACRIETGEDLNGGRYSENKSGADGSAYGSGINSRSACSYTQPQGRWPANVVHDGSEEVVAMFPSEAGASAPVRGTEASHTGEANCYGQYGRVPFAIHGDSGSAARFFYSSKASAEDRHWGTDVADIANGHPTVKPHELMRWLCRLITPPGGLVLDPFCGSGSTGRAAMAEGMQFVGIELDPQYAAIAEARMHATQPGLAFGSTA